MTGGFKTLRILIAVLAALVILRVLAFGFFQI
jgi:hypothetical protein